MAAMKTGTWQHSCRCRRLQLAPMPRTSHTWAPTSLMQRFRTLWAPCFTTASTTPTHLLVSLPCMTSSDAVAEAQTSRRAGITMYAVGIGAGAVGSGAACCSSPERELPNDGGQLHWPGLNGSHDHLPSAALKAALITLIATGKLTEISF